MIRFLKIALWLGSMTVLVGFGTSMAFPNLKLTLPSGKLPLAISGIIQEYDSTVGTPKRFVKIEGQLFEYNPSNVYTVNGIKTLYIMNGEPQAQAPESASPLSIIDTAKDAQKKAHERNRALEELTQ